ncbi:MAG: hypothetical protein ACOX2P_00950 [Bacillota bacterium]
MLLNNARTYLSPGERHLFASGITPNGAVNYLESIFAPLKQRYILRGPAGSGKATIVGKLYQAAVNKGITVEAFHCSLRPEEIEHLVFPDLKIGVITGSPPHLFRAAPGDIILDTGEFVNNSRLEPFKEDLAEADRRYVEALDRAVSFISRAKTRHDDLEAYYTPNMDFDGVNKCREKILKRILDYAGE